MPQPITVLIQDATLLRGTERAAISLANALAQAGHPVRVLSVFSTPQPLAYPVQDGIEVRHLSQPREVHGNFLLRAVKLLRVARSLRQHVVPRCPVISSEDMLSLAALLARVGRPQPVIAWQHLRYEDTHPFVVLLRRAFFRFLNTVVVLNRDDQAAFRRLGLRQVALIPNINSFRDIRLTDYSVPRLIAVGANVPEKGFDRLLTDAAAVLKDCPDWTLAIVGRDVPGPALAELAETSGIARQVQLCPPTQDISSEYLKSSICVVTSYRESFNLVITEAKARGLPTVAYDCPSGPRELVHDGLDGYLVPDGDAQTFQNRLRALMTSRDLRERLGRGAAESAERYSAEAVYTLWRSVLDRL